MGEIWKISFILLLKYALIADKAYAYRTISKIKSAFVANDIVPDIIPYAPFCKLSITYPNGTKVCLGNELYPTQTKNCPTVTWKANCCYYTLLMIDPDAPSRDKPTFRNFNHWLVGNIRGNRVASGQTIAEYIPPAPPLGSGLHRYVFLVYRQPSALFFNEPRLDNRSINNRTGFSVKDFTAKYRLGNPIYGNFFVAKYDDSVPALEKQLGV